MAPTEHAAKTIDSAEIVSLNCLTTTESKRSALKAIESDPPLSHPPPRSQARAVAPTGLARRCNGDLVPRRMQRERSRPQLFSNEVRHLSKII